MALNDLKNIKLVTFDVFGTLLDWRSYVEKFAPGGYKDFILASNARQRRTDPLVPYQTLLKEVLAEIRPQQDPTIINTFAQDIGLSSSFYDRAALKELSKVCLIGAISNCDYRHQFDAQRTLGIQWDVAVILAEQVGHYKPSNKAWQEAFQRIRTKTKVKTDEWLHVAAYTDYDLEPARKLGIKTCFVPRPGGTAASEAEAFKPDLMVSDLFQLCEGLCHAKGKPVRYSVKASLTHEKFHQRFVRWIRDEHGNELLAQRGCIEFRVLSHSNREITCEYLFNSKDDLEFYLEHQAPALRAKGREAFGEEIVTFTRSQETFEALGERRL